MNSAFQPFELEQYQSRWERTVEINLAVPITKFGPVRDAVDLPAK